MNRLVARIPDRWHYAAVLGACLLLTAPLEAFGARVHRRPARSLRACAVGAGPFLVWDLVAAHRGHWWFHRRRTLGPRAGGVPIEELAFFVVVPLCALLTHEAVGSLLDRRPRRGDRR